MDKFKNNWEFKKSRAKETGSGKTPPVFRRRHIYLNILLSLAIITVGIFGAAYINKTKPNARKRPPVKMTPLVQVSTVNPGTHTVTIPAMGTITPSREIILKSKVSGEVISTDPEFIAGGFIKKNGHILMIDPQDFILAVERAQSSLAAAEFSIKLEMGRQEVAKKEWELLNGNKPHDPADNELALRKPHLAKARADLASARAELKQARLDLARTKIISPFNAMVRKKNVDLGSQVSAQDELADLVSTDEYWIQVPIQVDRLKWIKIPKFGNGSGSRVSIFYQNGYKRGGSVIKLLGDLESEGRMARIIVSVKDPLNLESGDNLSPPLLIGEYVRVEIQGKMLENIYQIPRPALRDNETIWIMEKDNRMEIRKVSPVWRGADTVLLKEGLKPGDRLIVSDLSKPVNGMEVKAESRQNDEKNQMKPDRVKNQNG